MTETLDLFAGTPARHDPGGRVRLKVEAGIQSTAVFSPCDRYRYRLERRWSDAPLCMFLMMNPSTADIQIDDPTCRAAREFAKLWGFGGLIVSNTFAYRSTAPGGLLQIDDPVGPENDAHILQAAHDSGRIIAAWGLPPKKLRWRGAAVAAMLGAAGFPLLCLKTNGDGSPAHPLYIARKTLPYPYTGRPPEAAAASVTSVAPVAPAVPAHPVSRLLFDAL
jgi:hypothetical protein